MQTNKNKEALTVGFDIVSKVVDVILQVRTKTAKNALLADTDKVHVCYGLKKIPQVSGFMCIHIDLPHTPVSAVTDVCLIVKDLDRTDRDYDHTVEYYKDLLEKHGITEIKQIKPLKSIKIENQPYELKRRFALMYDVFLADSRIALFLPKLLGKEFMKRRVYEQINMEKKDLKMEISRAFRRSRCVINGKGNSCSTFVGVASMTKQQLVDNIIAATQQVSLKLPGGVSNIQTINVKMENTMSIPLYYSDEHPNNILVPNAKVKRKPFYMKPQSITPLNTALIQMTGPSSYKLIPKKRLRNKGDSSDDDDEPPTKK